MTINPLVISMCLCISQPESQVMLAYLNHSLESQISIEEKQEEND